MSELINLNKESFSKVISSENKTVLIDFWAPWCGPCKAINPILEELAQSYDGRVTIGKVDIDSNQVVAQQFGVQSIPNLLLFQGGRVVGQDTARVAPRSRA